MDITKLPEEAYKAYASVTDNKNFRGEEMPAFDDLPQKIKDAWAAASLRIARLTADYILNDMKALDTSMTSLAVPTQSKENVI